MMPFSTHTLDNEESSERPVKHSKKRKSKQPKTTIHQVNHDSQLLDAVSQGKIRVIKRLLDSRANPNHINDHGQTPLMLACNILEEGLRKEIMELLLRRGADPNIQDLQGRTLLMSAVQLEDDVIVQCLLQHKCNVQLIDADGNNSLFYAAIRGNDVLVRTLVSVFKQQGADIDQQNVQGLTPLLAACQEGHLEVARILVLEGGASPTIRDLDQFMTAEEWMKLSGFHSEDKLSFLSPSIQKKMLYRRQRQMKGIRTMTDYIANNEFLDGSQSPNVFSLRQNSSDDQDDRLPDLISSQQPAKSMFGSASSMFSVPQAVTKTTRKNPGYALGRPVPAKPPHNSKPAAFLTTKKDLYSSSYLSRRKSFLSKNPRGGYYHSGALEPLEGQRSIDNFVETGKSNNRGNRKKHDLLPPIQKR